MSDAFEALAEVRRWACDTLNMWHAGKLCGMLSGVSRHICELEDENERLREFVSQLMLYVDPASYQGMCNVECPAATECAGKSMCSFPDWAVRVANELEIKVDE